MIEAALLAALAAALGAATAGAVSGPGGMTVTAAILLTPAVLVGLGTLVVMLFTAPRRRRHAALRNKIRGRGRR